MDLDKAKANLGQSGEAAPLAWFADKDVPVLTYRVNRRPRAKGDNIFAASQPSFLDHLVECLLIGESMRTIARNVEREWKLGNREINLTQGWLAGRVGYVTDVEEEVDDYDEAKSEWITAVVETEHRATAPFAIIASSRYLCVVKHPTFPDTTLATVFEWLLNEGERQRAAPDTEWSVEPVLNEADFESWLAKTAVLDRVTFSVRLPNPDAEEAFADIEQHMRVNNANLSHQLTPRDPESGLSKQLDQDPIGRGFMEMVRRTFGRIKATGKSATGAARRYDQSQRVKRESVRMPADYDAAKSAVIEYGLQQQPPAKPAPNE